MDSVTMTETPPDGEYQVSWTLLTGTTICLSEQTAEGFARCPKTRDQVMNEARRLASMWRRTVTIADPVGAVALARVRPELPPDGPGDSLGLDGDEVTSTTRRTVPVPPPDAPTVRQAVASRLRQLGEDVLAGRVDPELVAEFLGGLGR